LELSALLQQALALHRQGRLEQARERYGQVLALEPSQFDALHLSGVIARQQGAPARAVELIRAALEVDAGQARAHCNLGAALQDLGQPEAAFHAYDNALHLDPRYALAWDNRGNTLRRLGRLQEALDSYERALTLQPASLDAWCHRAIVLNDLGRFDDAAASAGRALAVRPNHANALLALGNALQGLERFGQAVEAYDRALASMQASAQSPQPAAEILCARGAALKKSGELAQALDSYDRALLLRPDYAIAVHYRANVLRALGRREDAIAAYRRARELGANAADIDFALAALGEGELPASAPADYVKGLFDQYAGHFDRHLVEVLGYRTPELLTGLLQPQLQTPLESALDLGCGTGLCAPLLRPLARRLAGVDLSEKMLEKARDTGLYDELACADILAWLEGRTAQWDLVLAADVLVYVGELAPLFALLAQAARPGGWFAFSVETLAPAHDNATGYAITASNRFAHAPAYVRACAAEAGFTLVEMRDAALRKEHGLEVAGMLFLLRRS
jgi:predicted TPR repeat methyltransferase